MANLTDIPSVEEIKNRIISDVESKINDTVPALPISLVRAFAFALATPFHLAYQMAAWAYRQIFVSTQSRESLLREGANLGVPYQEATFGVVTATITGTDPDVDAGTLFVGPNQVTYRVGSTTAIPGDVALDALTAGSIGNLTTGDELTISKTTPGIDSVATVVEMTSTADDDEDIEVYRSRVALRKRTKFIYGSVAGYVLSGLETPNFTWVGVYADPALPGTVDIYGRVDLDLATEGIPTAPQLTELETYLRYDPTTGQEVRRPISDTLNPLAVINREFAVEITIEGAGATLKASIKDAVKAKVQSYAPYRSGVDASRNDTLTNSDLVVVSDALAVKDGAKIVSIQITDILAASIIDRYQFFGGTFGIANLTDITFVDV
jgi:uncharacterized phage protein gp47/JayE